MQQLKLMHVVHNDMTDGVQRALVSTTPDRRASSSGQLVVRDGDPVAVDCVAIGGCPPPSVVLRLGRRDITDLFTTSVKRSLSGQRRSMRRVHFIVVKRHRPVAGLTATTAYDGLTLRCLATVPGFGPLSVGLRLTVLCRHTSIHHYSLSSSIRAVKLRLRNAVITLRFDYDTTTIRLRRIARTCFHSTRFDTSKK